MDKKLFFRVSPVIPDPIKNTKFVKKLILSGSGPYEFVRRLFRSGTDHFRLTLFPFRADLLFCLVSVNNELAKKAKHNNLPIFCRLDGVGTDTYNMLPHEIESIKRDMKRSLSISDGIIFQSSFSEQAFQSVFGRLSCASSIIPNGMPDNTFHELSNIKRKFSGTFIVGGRNSPRKRIGKTIEKFINSPFASDYRLIVVGDFNSEEVISHKSVKYTGRITPNSLMVLLRNADGLLHLDWYDWCPNLVIEAISVGTPVLCGNIGGTKEIVKHSGVIADMGDPAPDFTQPTKAIPDIDQDKFDLAMDQFINLCREFKNQERNDLRISNIAKQYHDFFNNVLQSRSQQNV